MKKTKIKWLSIPLAVAFVLALSVVGFSALATEDQPTVMLDGVTKDFEVINAATAENGNADLFSDMKGLLPGDSVTQEITVGVKNFDDFDLKNITIYAEAVKGSEAGDYDVIMNSPYVHFTVEHDGKEITAPLSEGIPLGLFSDNGTTELTVSLSIDKEAGSEIEGLLGSVDWRFYVRTGPALNSVDHFAYIIGYPDGTVKPEAQITRAEVATIFFRLLTEEFRELYKSKTNDFSDVNSDYWYNNAVSTLANAGILSGYPDGTFRPDAPITRGEMAAIAARFETLGFRPSVLVETFSDTQGHWAESYIETASSHGWVNGYPDGTFCPDRNISRAEAMKLINYVLGRAVDESGLAPVVNSPYYNEWIDNILIDGSDPDNTLPWYYFHVQEATNTHDYYRTDRVVTDLPYYTYEEWNEVKQAPDWAALEKNW